MKEHFFLTGCVVASMSLLSGQEKLVDPFALGASSFGGLTPEEQAAINAAPDHWEVTCEVFSLPLKDAADLRRQNTRSDQIYAEVLQRVEAGTASLEEFMVLRTRLARKGSTQSVEEYLFPTEYDPPELPNTIGQLDPRNDTSGVSTPANPTSYDLRELGMTLEIQFKEKTSPDTVAVHLKANRMALKGRDTWGKEKAAALVPQFEVQGIDQVVKLKLKQPVLVGSMSPAFDHHAENRKAWFLFATGPPCLQAEWGKTSREKKMANRRRPLRGTWPARCIQCPVPKPSPSKKVEGPTVSW